MMIRAGMRAKAMQGELLIRLIGCMGLTASIAGCAMGPSIYQPPVEGPTAILGFEVSGNGYPFVTVYKEADECRGLQALPRLSEGKTSVMVPAGKKLSLAMGTMGEASATTQGHTATSCQIALTFVPDADAEYLARYGFSQHEMRCVAVLAKVSRAADGNVISASPVPAQERRWTAPFLATSPSCLP